MQIRWRTTEHAPEWKTLCVQTELCNMCELAPCGDCIAGIDSETQEFLPVPDLNLSVLQPGDPVRTETLEVEHNHERTQTLWTE